jgi:hypothetical protein
MLARCVIPDKEGGRRTMVSLNHHKEETETEARKTKEKKTLDSQKNLEDIRHIKIVVEEKMNPEQVTTDYYYG